jgi:hypothetical protein
LNTPTFASRIAGIDPRAEILAADAHALNLALDLVPGFYKLDMATRPGGVQREKLYVRHRRREPHGVVVSDPSAPPLGPMDWLDDEWFVPVYAVTLNDRPLGELWFDLPTPDDLERGVLRASMGFMVETAGRHMLSFRCAQTHRLPPINLDELVLDSDERSTGAFPVARVPISRPRLLPEFRARASDDDPGRRRLFARLLANLERDLVPKHKGFGIISTDSEEQARLRARIELGLARWLDSGDPGGAVTASEAAVELCRCPIWGHGRAGDMGADNDSGAGLNLASVALVYDWLHDRLEADAKAEIGRVLLDKARAMAAFFVLQRSYLPCGYLQNHFSITGYGFLLAALALLHEEPAAARWAALCRFSFREACRLQSLDGSSHPLEAAWGVGYVVRAQEALRQAIGDPPPRLDFFGKLPRFLRALGRSQSPACLFTLGSWLDAPDLAAWALAEGQPECIEDVLACPAGARTGDAPRVPRRAFFDDGGWFLINEGAMRVEFRAGLPFSRAHYAGITRYNNAHYAPDQGGVVVSIGGRIVLGQHQSSYYKNTHIYNCPVFNDTGQTMSTFCWGTKDRPERYPVLHYREEGDEAQASAELACCYLPGARLRSYVRRVTHGEGPAFVLEDDVRFEAAGNVVDLHFQAPDRVDLQDPRRLVVSNGVDALSLTLSQAPDSIAVHPARIVMTYRFSGQVGLTCRLRFRVPGDAFRLVTRLEPCVKAPAVL